jgi:hypothetical protein
MVGGTALHRDRFAAIHCAPSALLLALATVVFGPIGVLASIPISMESDGFSLHFDFGWFFLVPLSLGLAGMASWWRARNKRMTLSAINSQST